MRKNAFTLIELIFVIVIIGIMAGVGSSSFKPRYLANDTNFIVSKIREAQFVGISYEHNDFGLEDSDGSDNIGEGCIELTDLNESATDKNSAVSYQVKSTIKSEDGVGTLICFDSKGRPHDGDFTQSSLYSGKKSFTIEYNGKQKSITVEPITGYVIIKN